MARLPEDDFQEICPHENTTELVNDDGFLVEPAADVCLDCGKVFH